MGPFSLFCLSLLSLIPVRDVERQDKGWARSDPGTGALKHSEESTFPYYEKGGGVGVGGNHFLLLFLCGTASKKDQIGREKLSGVVLLP